VLTTEIVEALRRAGVRARVVEAPSHEVERMHRDGSIDMGLNTWIADYPDSDGFAALLHSETGPLGTMCVSPAIDRLVERGRIESEPSARHYVYRQIEDVITRQALMIPLYHPRNYRFARPELEGLELTSYTYPSVAYESLRIK